MRHPTKHFLTTKATKVSDIDILKLLNFVLFVTLVVKFAFSSYKPSRSRKTENALTWRGDIVEYPQNAGNVPTCLQTVNGFRGCPTDNRQTRSNGSRDLRQFF